jgi:hypothetical protein
LAERSVIAVGIGAVTGDIEHIATQCNVFLVCGFDTESYDSNGSNQAMLG